MGKRERGRLGEVQQRRAKGRKEEGTEAELRYFRYMCWIQNWVRTGPIYGLTRKALS
jgi:hypothetical protein